MIGMDGVAKQTPSILGEGVIFLLIVDFCFLILTLFRMECWVARMYWGNRATTRSRSRLQSL